MKEQEKKRKEKEMLIPFFALMLWPICCAHSGLTNPQCDQASNPPPTQTHLTLPYPTLAFLIGMAWPGLGR